MEFNSNKASTLDLGNTKNVNASSKAREDRFLTSTVIRKRRSYLIVGGIKKGRSL